MIFDSPPNDWKHLQHLVHQAFIEMGCHAEEPKTISLVRGNKEVDVYVEDVVYGIKSVYLIECKFWNSDVPQDVIHAFRTIVSDSGANRGIIVAKRGFQSGANEASNKTPIQLMTWEQFNTAFFEKWRFAATKSLTEKAEKLYKFRKFPYGPMCDEPEVTLTTEEHNSWLRYIEEFGEIAILGNRNILKELCDGPVRLLKPGRVLSDIESIEFWDVKTHREWYDYISPQLNLWCEKTDEWMNSFRIRTQSN